MMPKSDIKDMSQDQLAAWLEKRGIASYRAPQILKWIYLRQADEFEGMTDLSKEIRTLLDSQFSINRLEKNRVEKSRDGSKKYLFRLPDGNVIENVLIPERDHYTLCISSQVGCALGCRFCLTGRGGLSRNLTSGEIISQVRDIQKDLDEPKSLTNIVLMGMGEPLANYENVVKAIHTLTDTTLGLGFSNRKVTLSTSGLVDRLPDLGRDTTVSLAISLNATDNKIRDWLMPINKKYPIETLLEACRRYPLKPHRRITFEYILLKGVNDSAKDARQLAKLLRSTRAKINLIPFNPFENSEFQRPDESVINRFQQILLSNNYTAIIRRSKGQDISAACGQLKGHHRQAH
ncbi:MAG: 23S rRNA (adenine(2503)-C(2))-methyltransferase RlmN [Deltaproteobacteria bacterium]|nr:MAG: 23S rRNA (adenine(2503)-C(2))-methyltransferase RlmN [Deltaproteobacteria bacterium]